MLNKTKTISIKAKCINCAEEIKKADRSRKYAHELKNIFITISTVVNSEMECPTPISQQFSLISNNTSAVADSGDVSPFIMEGRRNRIQSKTTSTTNVNNTDSPFYFLKTLCDYGKTLIKEINEMGKEYSDKEKNQVEPFNIAKAIDFCVDMFDTKRKYDKAKKNLEIYSDINFSHDKVIKSISETGFKMVLINLLTNSYKFTIKGKIIVRAVSMPKEKKIRILVKDSGKGFNPNEFKKNGCFYVYEKNQDLNADGSGLGLTIVNEILTKFNIKLDCINNTEKGGSLFFFDLDDIYPYYDEVNPKNLMTDSLAQILKDINAGKKDNEPSNNRQSFNFKNSIINSMNKNKNKNIKTNDNIEDEKNNNNDNYNASNIINNNNISENISNNNNNQHDDIAITSSNAQNLSLMDPGDAVNASPTFFKSKPIEEKDRLRKSLQKKFKNLNAYNFNNATLFSIDKEAPKKAKNSTKLIDIYSRNIYDTQKKAKNSTKLVDIYNRNINKTPNNKQIDRLNSFQKKERNSKDSGNNKKEGKSNILKQVIVENKSFYKLKTFNKSIGKKGKEIQMVKPKSTKKNDEHDNENNMTSTEIEQANKIRQERYSNKKNYKKLLDKNFNKTTFYLFELKKIFLKNEIYVHLSLQNKKKCISEPSSKPNSVRKLKKKKSIYNNPNKTYIIICDDEEFVARSARELIINYYNKKGKEPHVYFTPNGIECLYLMYKLTFVENKKIEYILMDLEMPYLNGIKTCNIIKSIKETNIPVYILSGDEPNDCEADGYCNKPLNEVDIINKLDKER